jgi:pimeloyl-ACP methyl ester carboxylesterase
MSTTGADPEPSVTIRPKDEVRTAVATGGRRVAYAEYGDPDGRPLLAFHGTPGSRLFAGVYDAAARSRGVRVLGVDRPGYGRSDPWPDRTPATVGEWVAPVLDDAGVESAGVLGYSGGGIYALALDATRPDLVEGVDLVSGAVPASMCDPPRLLATLSTLAGVAPSVLGGLYRLQAWAAGRASASFVVSQFTTGEGPDEVPEDVAELVRRDFLEAVAESRSGAVVESRLFADDWGVDLDAVDHEVRLHHGDRDANVPVEGARRLAERLPDARIREYGGVDHLRTVLRSRDRVLRRWGR